MTDTSGINSTIANSITTNGRGAITGALLSSVLAAGGVTAWVATQYTPHVASLTALRGFTSVYATRVIRDDFAVGNGAPAMTYSWQATCPGTPDNIAQYVQPTGVTPGCWSAASDPSITDTREWGAVNDSTSAACGAHNNHDALQAEVDALGPGAKIYNAGWSCLTSQVNVSQPGQVISCKGGVGGHHDVGGVEFTAPAGFIAGSNGITMFRFKSATTAAIYGNGMSCALNGNSLASIGVDAYSVRGGTWDISGAHFPGTIFQADIDTDLGEIAGSAFNQYRFLVDQGLATDGATFKCNGTITADCSQDNFYQIDGITSGRSYAIDMDNGDSESFFSIGLYSNNVGGTNCPVRLRAGASAGQAARNNLFYYLGSTPPNGGSICPIYAEGTEAGGGRGTPSGPNYVFTLDTANNPSRPTVGTGASLYWSTINTPIGTQAYFKGTSATSVTDSAGLITQTGVIGPVASGDTGSSNLTTDLATGCTSVTIEPTAATTSHVVSCTTGSPSVVTVKNDGATSSYFYFTVIGY